MRLVLTDGTLNVPGLKWEDPVSVAYENANRKAHLEAAFAGGHFDFSVPVGLEEKDGYFFLKKPTELDEKDIRILLIGYIPKGCHYNQALTDCEVRGIWSNSFIAIMKPWERIAFSAQNGCFYYTNKDGVVDFSFELNESKSSKRRSGRELGPRPQ